MWVWVCSVYVGACEWVGVLLTCVLVWVYELECGCCVM